MRIPFVAGNWKMNYTTTEAEQLVLEMLEKLDKIKGVEKVLCPPFVSLVAINMMLQNSSIKLGAQNMYFETEGAYTGEISPLMLRELCEFVILGHSERRWYFEETDEVVNKKVKAALANKLKPILCVGERLAENEDGKTEEVVTKQMTAALNGIEPVRDIVIAYEPVWAIGTGRTATPEMAADAHRFLRSEARNKYGEDAAAALRILYGGSVKPDNIKGLMAQPEIDGVLVGGASLDPVSFASIVNY